MSAAAVWTAEPRLGFGGEAGLLARLRARDEDAFEELFRANAARMLATARRILRSEDDAHDAVQEAFLQAFRSLPSFAGDARLSTWLHRIVVNACLMRLRSRRRRPETSLDECGGESDGGGERPGSRPERPDQALEHVELCALLERAIARLPESYRQVLVLRDVQDLDTEEAVRRLGTSAGVVKTRLHRARRALRKLLERETQAAGAAPSEIDAWLTLSTS